MDAARKMDEQYRYQRYVYDFSRKYYLLGREQIIQEIALEPGQNLLEIGCGTGANLFKLAYRFPAARLYGLDASEMMLERARTNANYKVYSKNICFKQGLAQQCSPQQFGCDRSFDHILFSYVLSMIPDKEKAVEQALANLKPGGMLHIVDFSDQATMPAWFRVLLLQWLEWFNVHPDGELPGYLQAMEQRLGGKLQIRQLTGRYALVIHYQKEGQPDDDQSGTLQIPEYLDF